MHKTFFDQYNEFADACDIPRGSLLSNPDWLAVGLACKLVDEEWNDETKPALDKYGQHPSLESLVAVADGIADSIYVLCQLARVLGVPLNTIYTAVHANNMTKVGADGKVVRREDGKILKPEGFVPVNVWDLLFAESNAEAKAQGKMGAENWPA